MLKCRLSASVIASLPPPSSGQAFLWDDSLPGFGIRVSAAGRKTFVCQGRVNGRSVRVTVGRADTLTTEQARQLAKSRLGDLAKGNDVNRAKKLAKVRGVSLDAAYVAFCIARPGLKPRTTLGYRELIGRYLADWRNLPWTSVSRTMVLDRHRLIGEAHGQRTANNVMRALRSILSFARAKYRDPTSQEPLTSQNPVSVLNDTRSWFTESRRTDYLKPSEIRQWWDAVSVLGNETMADYCQALLLTGTRGGELARLKWSDVDLKNRLFEITDSKNGDMIHLPLCSYLRAMLVRRAADLKASPFVFPASSTRKSGKHVSCANRFLHRVGEHSGVPMRSRHGLRRTYASIAERLGVGTFTIKRILGHTTGAGGDVTKGYIQFDIEALRGPTDRIAAFILRAAGVVKSAEVVQLEAKAASD